MTDAIPTPSNKAVRRSAKSAAAEGPRHALPFALTTTRPRNSEEMHDGPNDKNNHGPHQKHR